MPKLSEYMNRPNLIVMIKGEPKVGKKHIWASFPEPIYAFDTDYRMASIANDPLINKRDIEFDTYDDFDKIKDKLEKFKDERPKYKTIAFHSLTSLARLTQQYIFDNRGTSQDMRTVDEKKRDKANLRIGQIPLMGISDYNGESSALNQVCTSLRVIYNKWNVNVVLVAHIVMSETTTLEGNIRTSRRIITGGNKIASEIPGYFNEVWHVEIDSIVTGDPKAKYICHTRPTPTDFAGTALYGIPAKIDFTNKLFYPELEKYIKNPITNPTEVLI